MLSGVCLLFASLYVASLYVLVPARVKVLPREDLLHVSISNFLNVCKMQIVDRSFRFDIECSLLDGLHSQPLSYIG